MQKKVQFLSDIYLEEFNAIFCNPQYKADKVNNVSPMLKIAEVLVKAALSNVATERAGRGANRSKEELPLPYL